MSDFLSRIREAVGTLGSQKEAAEKTGIPYATLQRILAGKVDVGLKRLEMIASATGQTVEYFIGSDGVIPAAVAEERRDFGYFQVNDLVSVQEIDLTFGMGATYMDVPVTSVIRQFDRALLRQYTKADPEHLFFAEGVGDSMTPTITDHDLLLVDTSQKDLRISDKIWVVSYGQVGMVKRLRPLPDGSVQILSDNKLVPPAVAYDGELHIIGRVVGSLRKH